MILNLNHTMKVFKIRFKWHHDGKITNGWIIVTAKDSEEAAAFADRDLMSKLNGYTHIIFIKELCVLKDKPQYIENDFYPDTQTLSWYNEE